MYGVIIGSPSPLPLLFYRLNLVSRNQECLCFHLISILEQDMFICKYGMIVYHNVMIFLKNGQTNKAEIL